MQGSREMTVYSLRQEYQHCFSTQSRIQNHTGEKSPSVSVTIALSHISSQIIAFASSKYSKQEESKSRLDYHKKVV